MTDPSNEAFKDDAILSKDDAAPTTHEFTDDEYYEMLEREEPLPPANRQNLGELLTNLAEYNGFNDPGNPLHLPQVADEEDILQRLNNRFVSVIKQGEIFDLYTGHRMSMNEFEKVHYRDLHIQRPAKKEGEEPKLVKAATVWLNQTDKNKAVDYTYEPGAPRLFKGLVNLWTPVSVQPKKGDVKPWTDLLDWVFQGLDPKHRKYFEQWCAWPFKYPSKGKMSVAALFYGGQGIGKGLIATALLMLYGQDNGTYVTNAIFQKSFNKWAEAKQFALLDEIRVDRKDALAQADKFKGIISEKVIAIEGKGDNPTTLPNHLNVLVTSNHNDSLPIEDDDRRWFVVHSLAPKMTDSDEGRKLRTKFLLWRDGVTDPEERSWLESLGVNVNDHLGELLYHFQNDVKFEGFDPHGDPPITEGKLAMQQEIPQYKQWLKSLLEDPSIYPFSVVTSNELLQKYTLEDPDFDLKLDTFSKSLSELKFVKANSGKVIKTKAGSKRLWLLDKRLASKDPGAIGKIYDAEHENNPAPKASWANVDLASLQG